MPFQFDQGRRHKIEGRTGRIMVPASVRRGSLTLWVTEEAVAAWLAPATGRSGDQAVYSDLAIETELVLRLVLHQPLRKTEGAVSLVETAMHEYKTIFGRGLPARSLSHPHQKPAANIGCNVLNRGNSLGVPVSVRVK